MPDPPTEIDHDPTEFVPGDHRDVAATLGLPGKAVQVTRPDDSEEPGILRAAYRPAEDVTRVLVARTDAPLLDCPNDRVEVLE